MLTPSEWQMLEEWCIQIDSVLKQPDMDLMGENDDTGPAAELSWWRTRVAKLAGVVEQLKGRDARMVIGLAAVGESRVCACVDVYVRMQM